jgi:DNA-binding NarL/FixJ family response regulator
MAKVDITHPDDRATAAWQRAEADRLDLRSDPARWAEVAVLWRDLGRPIPAAYARWREAEARLDLGADVHATAAVRAAHAAALDVGATALAAEVRRLAGWHRVDLVAPVADPDPDALQAYRLTPREVEVLTGLAAGRTNQEIADHLFISVKTASVHVSNILRKLHVSGRQEAGRVAHRLGVSG